MTATTFRRAVILTGAGISQESGLPTYRDPDGLWAKERMEEVATPQAFRKNPRRVHDFYNARRRQLLDPAVCPNAAHLALARLERDWPGKVLVVTQNIDDLHERAGTRHLLHLHGELLQARCLACEAVLPWRQELDLASLCPACGERGRLRVNLVWFGEMPFGLERVEAALAEADLFVAIGTSGSIYPAAGFVTQARAAGARTLELNLEASELAGQFHAARQGPASLLVPDFVEALLAQRLSI